MYLLDSWLFSLTDFENQNSASKCKVRLDTKANYIHVPIIDKIFTCKRLHASMFLFQILIKD